MSLIPTLGKWERQEDYNFEASLLTYWDPDSKTKKREKRKKDCQVIMVPDTFASICSL
jgi:hypothetical protein